MRIAKRNHVLALIAICAVTYFLGLATHGLTNWQEGQRALVAREMQQRSEWIVPTINGEPYLAKPPMIYWCQLVSARTRSLLGGAEEVGAGMDVQVEAVDGSAEVAVVEGAFGTVAVRENG